MAGAIEWFPLGEHQVDKPTTTSNFGHAYPHTIPGGWKETNALSGIAAIPIWTVKDGQHELSTLETVAYRLVEREMFFPGITRIPLVHREILQRETFKDWGWNSRTKQSQPMVKMRWSFVYELDHYHEAAELKALAEEYHRNRFPCAPMSNPQSP